MKVVLITNDRVGSGCRRANGVTEVGHHSSSSLPSFFTSEENQVSIYGWVYREFLKNAAHNLS